MLNYIRELTFPLVSIHQWEFNRPLSFIYSLFRTTDNVTPKGSYDEIYHKSLTLQIIPHGNPSCTHCWTPSSSSYVLSRSYPQFNGASEVLLEPTASL